MAIVHFTGCVLPPGKRGVLTPDADGYYDIVLGGLNVYNSVGQFYVEKSARSLFEGSTHFMRRIKKGALKGEVGHPRKQPGMSMDDYIDRILNIVETNICCHISDVWLDEAYGAKHPDHGDKNLIAIIGKVRPAGVHGAALKEALENGKENVFFSIRALSEDKFVNGRTERTLVQIVTWDWVTEAGLGLANKYDSPSLEDIKGSIFTDFKVAVTTDMLLKVAKDRINSPLALEDSRFRYAEILQLFESKQNPSASVFSGWQ